MALQRPVHISWPISQAFGAYPTRSLPWNHPTIQSYGNYQPYGHLGIDYAVPVGTPVYAAHDGVIDHADWGYNAHPWVSQKWAMARPDNASGICVLLDGGNGLGTTYSHMSRTHKNAGDRVRKGDLIGYSGNTGRSGGPHCHFERVRLPAPFDGWRYGRIDPGHLTTLADTIKPIPKPKPKPKEWDEMASKNEIKAAMREENAALSGKLDAVLHQLRGVPLPAPNVGKTTDNRTKIMWANHESVRNLNAIQGVAAKLDALTALAAKGSGLSKDEASSVLRDAVSASFDQYVPVLIPTEDQETTP